MSCALHDDLLIIISSFPPEIIMMMSAAKARVWPRVPPSRRQWTTGSLRRTFVTSIVSLPAFTFATAPPEAEALGLELPFGSKRMPGKTNPKANSLSNSLADASTPFQVPCSFRERR